MGYKLRLVRKEGCTFSEMAHDKLKSRNIIIEDILVDNQTKGDYKSGILKTFPQIYLTNGIISHLLGDSNNLAIILDFYDILKNNKIIQNNTILKFLKKNKLQYLDPMALKYFLCLLAKKDNSISQDYDCDTIY
jgi:hypothetical protein